MFFVHRVTDTLAIPPTALAIDTKVAVEQAIDDLYPGRVWLDLGLVVSRYHSLRDFEENGSRTRKKQRTDNDDIGNDDIVVGPGACVAGQAPVHVTATFSLILFRPFLEEVCVGRIAGSNARGIQISIGFFDKIYVPAYWMLRPSTYEADTGLWVWTPAYDEEGEDDGDEHDKKDDAADSAIANESVRYEMPIGSAVRFKVKALQFARVTQTAKGRQATTTRTTSSEVSDGAGGHAVRRRSSSVGIDDHKAPPPPMKIMASLCEDGLGLVSWWEAGDEDDDEEKEEDPSNVQEIGEKATATTITEEELIDASPETVSSRVKAEKVKSEPPS